MIERIVRMIFKDGESFDKFQAIYSQRNPAVNKVAGCRSVKIMRDINAEHAYYTVSVWDSNEDLEVYRASAYFGETWPMVKAQLAQRAEVFSMTELDKAI